MRIFLYISIIFLGAWLSAKGKLKENFIAKLSHFQYASLLILLFVMGMSIGVNEQVISSFYRLGYQALILALSSIVFSILFVRLVSRYVLSHKDERSSEQ